MPLCPLCWTLKLDNEMRVVKVKSGAIEACVECVGPIRKSLLRAEEHQPLVGDRIRRARADGDASATVNGEKK